MTLLLCSYVCDYCDGTIDIETPYRAFVAWPRGSQAVAKAYLFPTEAAAANWIRSVRRKDVDVREVRLAHPPTWKKSRGSVKDIELADGLYEVCRDRQVSSDQRRAFLF